MEADMLAWTLQLNRGPKRCGHAAVAVGHKVYCFGGDYFRETHMGQIEVLIFDTVKLCWMKLPIVPTGIEDSPPSVRWCHTAVRIDNIIYIWGGTTKTNKYSKVLYAFDVNTHGWSKPKTTGTVPEGRVDHSACVLGKAMYIFGGFNKQTGRTNDIHKLDTTTMVWTLINTSGTPPAVSEHRNATISAPVSEFHSATIIGTKMFVFGGNGDQVKDQYNICVFDTETNRWSTPSACFLPKEESEGHSVFAYDGDHSAFAYNGELYIFGGRSFRLDQTFNVLWKFNPETLYWKKVKPKGEGPCMMSRMCTCVVGGRVIFFGGYTLQDVHNLYMLDLGPGKKFCEIKCRQPIIKDDDTRNKKKKKHGSGAVRTPIHQVGKLAAMTENSESTPKKRKRKEKHCEPTRKKLKC